jgi:hypothetical protein
VGGGGRRIESLMPRLHSETEREKERERDTMPPPLTLLALNAAEAITIYQAPNLC